MAQLDRFLAVMVSNRAESLILNEGEAAALMLGGSARPITKQQLTAQQIVGLLREIAPPEAAGKLNSGSLLRFTYQNSDGVFSAYASRESGPWQVVLTPAEKVGLQRQAAPLEVVHETGMFDAASLAPSAQPARASAATPPARPQHAPRGAAAETPVHGAAVRAGAERARGHLEKLLAMLVERDASDLHLRVGEPPILRLHGEMLRLDNMPPMDPSELEAMLLSIMPERNRNEFGQLNDTDFAHEIEGVARFRSNVLRDRKGIAAVFRVIPATVVTVEQLGISQEVQNLCYLTKGLVLVTGPTGSGKSTTLCSLIDLVNRKRTDHVITIEDPIEFVHPNKNCIITQRQVGVHTSSFKHALRAALREDPDIVLVGELRDLETVSIAIETAETGHLVFGTLHTTTAASTIDRVIDQFPPDRQEQIRVMLSESLKGVVSQILCKKIGGGRVAAREILLTIPAVSNLIREGKTFQIPSVMQTSRRLGMVTLNDALIDLVDAGQVEPKEAYMKSVEKIGFLNMLKQRGHAVDFVEAAESATPQGAKPTRAAAGAAR